MNQQEYGGVVVAKFELNFSGKKILSSGLFDYFIYKSFHHETIKVDKLESFSIYVFEKAPQTKIKPLGTSYFLQQGDCLQVERDEINLFISGGSATLLIAGTRTSHPPLARKITFIKHKNIYKVEKPWGYELWLNGRHPCYALKKIFLKAGTKTSLQYHNFKQETNVLFQGKAKLHYKKNITIENRLITTDDIKTVLLEPISAMHVTQQILHRVEAVTDIVTVEASTPHLDDVIRVQDDNKRPSGRLIQEHVHS